MHTRLMRAGVVGGALVASALLTVIAINSTRWLGATFPGFFVMANRVVPSISLPMWGTSPDVFQHQVVAVDGVPVNSAAAIYARAAEHAPGTPVRYTLRASDGTTATEMVPSRRLSRFDYLLIFGAFLLTGAAFIATAFAVVWLRPHGQASMALLSACLGLGVFALTAADLYGPHWFFRLHVLAEALFPAGFIHLALVFPTDRLGGRRRSVLLAVYLGFALLALFYECVLYWPSAYTTVHLIASGAHGLSGLVILAGITYDRLTTTSPLVRQRIGIVGAGVVTAFVGPTLLMGGSGLLGGSVPVNGAAFTAFIFPFSLAYAILTEDLLAIATFLPATADQCVAMGVAARALVRARALRDRLNTVLRGRLVPVSVGGAAAFGVALIGIIAVHSTRWVDTTFPGFFLMANRVVPSISLAQWEPDASRLFQQAVLAVDGVPVDSAAAAYARVRQQPAGTLFRYTVRGPDGTSATESVRSRVLSSAEYMSLFGSFLLTGSAFLLTGLLVFLLRPRSAATQGFLSAGVVGGLFVLTAVDLYGPHWFFRLHVIAEALVPASLIHLALVFPTNRLRQRAPLLLGVYLTCLALAGSYELVLYWPAAYSAVHLVASTAQGIGGLTLIWLITYDLLTTTSVLVRRRILVAALGTLAAFLVPTVLMGTSGLFDGRVPVNAAALTGFLFPLCFGYAIVKRDLLKIDVFFQQAATVVIAVTTTTYFSALSGLIALKVRLR